MRKLSLRKLSSLSWGGGIIPRPPAGYRFVIDDAGRLLLDDAGNLLLEEI